MSIDNLRGRVKKLGGRQLADPSRCYYSSIGALVTGDDPDPAPEKVHPCANCGGRHVLREVFVVVNAEGRPS
jgi:hypothetical protein